MVPRGRSLRFKFAFWSVLVFFLIQTILVGGVVLFRRERIQSNLDDGLQVAAESMVQSLLNAGVEWSVETIIDLVPKDSGFVLWAIRDEDLSIPLVAHPPEAADLPFSDWEMIPAGPVGAVFGSMGPDRAEAFTGTSSELRLITIPFRQEDQLYYFQAAVRDQVLDRLLGPFVDLVVIGVPVGILAAMIAAWLMAGRVVTPILQLSEAARGVSPARLGERFQVGTSAQEIARLEADLNSALERLEEGYKAQDQFISNVSHELKTPISVLLTEIQVARLGHFDPARLETFVGKVEREMKRLAGLVESFLILARSDPGSRPRADRVAVHDLVLECAQRCRLLADQKRIHLVPTLSETDEVGVEPELSGDADLLQTMVENLVRNAIAHSPQGGVVAIDAQCTAEHITIAVRDEGPGVPEEYRGRIFQRFVQVPSSGPGLDGRALPGRKGGLGIGLAIASNVAQMHGGGISAENRPEGGCTFVVKLPLTRLE